MVNENLKLITENKKPIETVYEIKNEIPSFEEFMKTYENDSNLNYGDLDSGSVGEVKGYGPCSSCGRSDHIFKLEFGMFNGDFGRSEVFYSIEEALETATDISLGQNGWENEGLFSSSNPLRFSSELRRKSANAIKDAVRIYRLGGSINGWLEVKKTWTEFKTRSNYACGTDINGNSL